MAPRPPPRAERLLDPKRVEGIGSALFVACALASAAASGGCARPPAEPPRAPALDAPYRILGPSAPTLDASMLAPGNQKLLGSLGLAGASPRGGVGLAALARCPADMALVDDRICVDRWEATIVVLEGGRETPHTPYEPLDAVSAPFRAVSRQSVVPHGYVSGSQAETACRASGKRLCTTGEWERACRGPEKTRYPYGQDRRSGACNDDVRALHPVVEAARRLGVPAEDTWTTGMNLLLVNQLPGGLASTGARAECESPEGVYDLVGNLHEWVADADGTFRGGFYMDTTQNGEGCAYQTTAHDFDYHDYSTGFRCCSHADGIE